MADFMRLECENPEMKQSEKANQLSYSCSTLQRYENEINMLSSYRIQPNNTKKNKQKRFQILVLTTIHIVTSLLKDFK